jgi:hypothetical protein
MKTILSYGLGIESSSLLVYWCENRSRLDFDLTGDLIAVTAMTGDEHIDTKIQVERAILPRLREHDIRYVQVARAGHLESEGIIVLDDTREPRAVYLDGAYKLSDELRAAGTLPQYAGEHRCALKKYWVRQEKTTLFFLACRAGNLAPNDRSMQCVFVSLWLLSRF